MRISDWSSDVCSSDLLPAQARCRASPHPLRPCRVRGRAMPRRSGRLSEGPDRRGLTQLGKSNVMADPQNDKVLSADQRIETIPRLNDDLRQFLHNTGTKQVGMLDGAR